MLPSHTASPQDQWGFYSEVYFLCGHRPQFLHIRIRKKTFLSLKGRSDSVLWWARMLIISSYYLCTMGKHTVVIGEVCVAGSVLLLVDFRDWYASSAFTQCATSPVPKDASNLKKTKWVYICKHLFSWTEKGLHQHIVQPCKITQKLKIRFLVHKCNESLMSSNPLQTMKTKFKPLKKFSALVKCISSGDKISKEDNADEWHLVIGRTLKKKWNNFPA